MRYAVTDNALGYVKRWGDCDFTVDAGETKHAVDYGAHLPAGMPAYYCTVKAGVFAELTVLQKAAVDADRAAKDKAEMKGATTVGSTIASTAELPKPPPRAGLLVPVIRSGKMVLALSSETDWGIFEPTTTVSAIR